MRRCALSAGVITNGVFCYAGSRAGSRIRGANRVGNMCRNIKTLFNFDPPATDDEVRASALQFVRKISGTTRPSKANEAVFAAAVDEVTEVARRLVDSLVTTAAPKNREAEAARARARNARRFGPAENL